MIRGVLFDLGGTLHTVSSPEGRDVAFARLLLERLADYGITLDAEPEELAQSMSIQEPYAYLLREKDGFLAVYGQDGTTFLFETNIRMRSLDEEMQAKVEAGIPFADERELYDFLESYSS